MRGKGSIGGDVVNIFTIASGHMYERLQKIMMLSVLRHTKSKVKFWLIKNYMSPQMRAVMPLMAAQYGFEVRIYIADDSAIKRNSDSQRSATAHSA